MQSFHFTFSFCFDLREIFSQILAINVRWTDISKMKPTVIVLFLLIWMNFHQILAFPVTHDFDWIRYGVLNVVVTIQEVTERPETKITTPRNSVISSRKSSFSGGCGWQCAGGLWGRKRRRRRDLKKQWLLRR